MSFTADSLEMESLVKGSWESVNEVDLGYKKRVRDKFEYEKTVTEATTVSLILKVFPLAFTYV